MAENHQTLLNGKPLSYYDKDGLELKSKKRLKKSGPVFAIIYIIVLIVTYWFIPKFTYLPEDIRQCRCEVQFLRKFQDEDAQLIRDNLENWREFDDFKEFCKIEYRYRDDFSRSGSRINYSVYVSLGEMYERFNNLSTPAEPAELDIVQKLVARNHPYTDEELLDIIFTSPNAETLQSLLNDLEQDQNAVGVRFTFMWTVEDDDYVADFLYDSAINEQGASFAEVAKLLQILIYVAVAVLALIALVIVTGTVKVVSEISVDFNDDDDDYYRDDRRESDEDEEEDEDDESEDEEEDEDDEYYDDEEEDEEDE